jgi:putative ABC transport system substrate-binding protein
MNQARIPQAPYSFAVMERRAFIGVITGGLLAAPLAAEAQQVAKVPKLGFLSHGSSEGAADSAFMRALRDLGWVDGRTIVIEARYTAGSLERTQEFVREFIARDVDVIVAWSPYAVAAAKRGTRTTPIVGLAMGTLLRLDWSSAWRGRAPTSPGWLISRRSCMRSDSRY